MSAAPAKALPLAALRGLPGRLVDGHAAAASSSSRHKAQVAARLGEHGWANLCGSRSGSSAGGAGCTTAATTTTGWERALRRGVGGSAGNVAEPHARVRRRRRRKFGALISWPGVPTLAEVDGLRTRCGATLARSRRVAFTPDKCAPSHVAQEKEHLRCLRRLVGVNWLEERAPLIELSKVHAFTGVQVLLKSVHRPLRQRVAQLVGGCLPPGATRSNLFGVLLGALCGRCRRCSTRSDGRCKAPAVDPTRRRSRCTRAR